MDGSLSVSLSLSLSISLSLSFPLSESLTAQTWQMDLAWMNVFSSYRDVVRELLPRTTSMQHVLPCI